MNFDRAAFLMCVTVALWCANTSAVAQETKVETIVDGLTNPCGIAIQPESGHLFVADSGANRIVRIVDGKIEEVVIGFPAGVLQQPAELPKQEKENTPADKRKSFSVGPLSLTFLDKSTLLVGCAGSKPSEHLVRGYTVPDSGKPALTADQMFGTNLQKDASDEPSKLLKPTELLKPGPRKPTPLGLPATAERVAEGVFYGLLATEEGVYATASGDLAKGWIGRADRVGNRLYNFKRYIASTEDAGIPHPSAITRSPEGYLVVGSMGSTQKKGDSHLTFYNEQGEALGDVGIGLNDVTGFAYSPKRGYLFAIDFDWASDSGGQLAKIIEDGDAAKPIKIADLAKPTAMVFDSKGNLYVTVFGTGETPDAPQGQLLKITGLDQKKKTATKPSDSNPDEDKAK